MSVRDELRQVFRLLLAVDRILAKHSPVLIVQRYIRSHLARKQLSKSPNLKIRYSKCRLHTKPKVYSQLVL